MDTILSVTKAKSRLLDLVRRAKEEGEVFTLTRQGSPEGIVMSYEEYEGMKETLDILSDPKLMRKIRKGIQEAKKGEVLPHEEVFKGDV